MERFLIVIERGKNNYSSFCPDLPGCAATGEDVEEALNEMEEALRLHLEDLKNCGVSAPRAHGIKTHASEIESGDFFAFVNVDPENYSIAA